MTEEVYSHPEIKKDFMVAQHFLKYNDSKSLSALIDSTRLKPQAQEQDMQELCEQAKQTHFRSVCLPPCYVSLAKIFLTKNALDTVVCTVIGFPNGYQTIESKCFEAKQAIEMGASEIDFVQNISFVKSNNFIALQHEFLALVETVRNGVLKVILETSLLTEDEIYHCSLLAAQCGIHIIKTSTGFGSRGASIDDIKLIKKALDEHCKKTNIRLGIKASGGIQNSEDVLTFIKTGATRIGTSNGDKIINELTSSRGEPA